MFQQAQLMAIDCLSKLYGWVITVVKEVFKFWVVWSGHEDFFFETFRFMRARAIW